MRVLRFTYAIAAYLLFFATFCYLVGFVGNLLVPKGIDTVPATGAALSTGMAVVVDLLLIALFGVQHSVMARRGFKSWLTRALHPAIERSTYVLATVIVLWVLMVFWQPIPAVVWQAEAGWLVALLWALFGIGWAVVFISTWLLNHFELFGLHQAWLDLTGREAPPPRFREPAFYRLVRHPLYLGLVLAFWAIPTMTFGHLVFAGGMTVYILVGIRYEERDLLAALGAQYAEYRTRVGMIVPGLGKAKG